jgi:hypothetical protein
MREGDAFLDTLLRPASLNAKVGDSEGPHNHPEAELGAVKGASSS